MLSPYEMHVDYEVLESHIAGGVRIMDVVRVHRATLPHLCSEKDSTASNCDEPYFDVRPDRTVRA